MQNTTMLYLIEPQDFSDALKASAKNRYETLDAEILEIITYDDVEYNLYKINTNSINVMIYAGAVSYMDGNVLKNRFTGDSNLPKPLKQLFERHTKSAGGSETK